LLLLLGGLTLLVGGCATLAGDIDSEKLGAQKKLVDTKEEPRVPFRQELAVKYNFNNVAGNHRLEVTAEQDTLQDVVIKKTYQTEYATQKKLNGLGQKIFLGEGILALCGGVMISAPAWLTPDPGTYQTVTQPGVIGSETEYVPGNLTQQDIQNIQYWGIGIAASCGIGFLVDLIEQGTSNSTVTSVESNTEVRPVLQAPCSGCDGSLDLGEKGVAQFKTGVDGKASVDLDKLNALEGRWDSIPWGTLRVGEAGWATAEAGVTLDASWKSAHDYEVQKAHMNMVSKAVSMAGRLADEQKWGEAYRELDSSDALDADRYLRTRIRDHIAIGSSSKAYELYPPVDVSQSYGMENLITNPVRLKGKVLEIPAQIVQKLDDDSYLAEFASGRLFMLVKSPLSECPFEFVTGQIETFLAEVEGTYTYETTNGGSNTVPLLKVIWTKSLN
jgi:hypothetical protein